MKVSPQQQARSCCNPLLLRQDEREGVFASELPSSHDGWPFLVPGASGWACQQPLLCHPAPACQLALEPSPLQDSIPWSHFGLQPGAPRVTLLAKLAKPRLSPKCLCPQEDGCTL